MHDRAGHFDWGERIDILPVAAGRMDLELNRRQFDPDGLICFVFQENLDGQNPGGNGISLAEFLLGPLGVYIGIG